MTDDIVGAGSDRPPLATPWLVAGAVLLLALAAAGTLRATDLLHLPHAAPSPSPTAPVPPLATIPPSVTDVLGSLVPDPRAIEAKPYGPGEGVTVVVTTESGILSIATVDDMQRSLLPAAFNESLAGVVETRRGPAWVVRPWDFDEHTDSTLFVPDHDEGILLDGPQALFPGGRDDELWTVTYDGVEAQRRDLDGRAVGSPVRLPPGAGLVRGTEAGLLVASWGDTLKVWDPVNRRYVRTINPNGYSLATTARYVVWSSYCRYDERCLVHLTDVTTGQDWRVPVPAEPGSMGVTIDPSGQYLAYSWDTEATPDSTVYFWRRGDAKPRRILVDPDDRPIRIAWTSPDRLVIAQSVDEQTVLYGWDRRTGALRLGGAYLLGSVETIVAAH